ncbi:MAG: DUF1573 domain-containing protein [Acidobacteriia bacterium]|nr:DUF1573 domain-containing protein [Terriglobia bacterium]
MRRSVLPVLPLALGLAVMAARGASRPAEGPPRLTPSGPPPAPAGAPVTPAVPAQLVVEKETVDLGDVVRGTKAEATFVLRNAGKNPVKILSARPG